MTLLYLYTEPFGFGGAHSDVKAMASALSRRRHRVILGSRRSPMVDDFLRSGGEHRDVEFRFRSPRQFLAAVTAVRQIARGERVDVVTPQSFATLVAAAAALFCYRRRPPIVTTIHNVCRPIDYPIGARLLNLFSDLTIFESRFEHDQLVARGLDASRCVVIHNGIDLDRFSPRPRDPALMRQFGLSPDTPVAGIVARLAPEKALDVLIAAWARVADRIAGARLMVVGDGPLRSDLEGLVRANGTESSVVFAGAQADVPRFLSLFDCFVLTSSRESFPLAAREAMGAGRAVIAPRVGGCPEVVVDGETGVLVPPGDVAGFAAAMTRLLGDRTATGLMGLAGRRKAERDYREDRWVDANEHVFAEMAGGAKPRRLVADRAGAGAQRMSDA